jgi:hypothetical protein
MSKSFNPKGYLENLDRFLKEIEVYPHIKERFKKEEQLVDLFRFWYMDCREQEIVREAMKRENDDRWGLGDMLDE